MPSEIQKLAIHQDKNIWPSATIGDILLSTVSHHRGRTGSTYNFAIAKERNVVLKPKWSYKASACTRPQLTAGDTTVSRISKMAGITGSGANW